MKTTLEQIDIALKIVQAMRHERQPRSDCLSAGAALGTFIDYTTPDPFPMQYYYTKLAAVVNE